MPRIDPWTSVLLRAHALNLSDNDRVFAERADERSAFFSMIQALGIDEELRLRLRPPAEEMPWTATPYGSRLHHFWTAMHALYSPSWWNMVSTIGPDHMEGIEPALVFLEADPWCHRSGYAKQDLLRFLRRPRLLYRHQMRLRRICLAAVRAGPRMEFREYCRTASVVDGGEFRLQLHQLERQSDGAAGERARWMLEALIRRNGE